MTDAETSPIEPMEALLVDALPADSGWQFEPKWDGFRCLAVKEVGNVRLFAKSGKPLHRFFRHHRRGFARKADVLWSHMI